MNHDTFLIINAKSRDRFPKAVARLAKEAAKAKVALESAVSSSGDELANLSEEAARRGFRHLLVFGGDGSLHHAAQGLMRVADCSTILVPIPFGTGNDFYRGLDQKRGFDFAKLFRKPKIRRISVGEMRIEGGEPRYFINSFSFGITPSILKRYEALPVRHYLVPTVWTLFDYRPLPLEIQRPALTETEPTLIFMICKGPFSGGGMRFHPNADHHAPQVVWIPRLPLAYMLRHLPKVYAEGLPGVPGVRSFAFEDLGLRFPAGNANVEMDGEVIPVAGTVRLRILPDALAVATPE